MFIKFYLIFVHLFLILLKIIWESLGKIHYYIELQTRTYPFFTILHSLFYKNKIKTLPATEILFQLITPVSLAHMIMCDGARRNESVIICTDNLTINEVVKLMNILIVKFRLNCTLHYDNDKARIYISKSSINTLINLVNPYIIPSMQYKLKG